MVKHPVSRFAAFAHGAVVALVVCVMGLLPACGGSDDEPATPSGSQLPASAQPSVQGARVSGREEALRIVARGVVAPLYYGELVQGALARAFAMRPSAGGAEAPAAPGDRWVVAPGAGPSGEGRTEVDIEAADDAEGLLLRGEAGSLRAVLRFENAALGAARLDGAVTLDVSCAVAGAGSAHRTRAETLAVTDAQGTMEADRGWTIAVDNDQDDEIDSVVRASADEARALAR
jgi:hypothetical protein